jgi:hypothetical protein
MKHSSSPDTALSTVSDLRLLSDSELRSATNHLRILEAQAPASAATSASARAHEAEMNRRFGGDTTVPAALADHPEAMPAWRNLLTGTIRLTGMPPAKRLQGGRSRN